MFLRSNAITNQQLTISNWQFDPTLFASGHSGSAHACRFLRDFVSLLRQHVVADAAGINRQAAVVQYASEFALPFWRQLQLHQLHQLRVPVLLDDVYTLVSIDESLEVVSERIG